MELYNHIRLFKLLVHTVKVRKLGCVLVKGSGWPAVTGTFLTSLKWVSLHSHYFQVVITILEQNVSSDIQICVSYFTKM